VRVRRLLGGDRYRVLPRRLGDLADRSGRAADGGRLVVVPTVVVIGLALGALLRKTAAGLAVFAAVFFVVPIVVAALPQKITEFAPYLPSDAGGALWGSPLDTVHALSP
jgi:ABC-2 type transport system permease protein